MRGAASEPGLSHMKRDWNFFNQIQLLAVYILYCLLSEFFRYLFVLTIFFCRGYKKSSCSLAGFYSSRFALVKKKLSSTCRQEYCKVEPGQTVSNSTFPLLSPPLFWRFIFFLSVPYESREGISEV